MVVNDIDYERTGIMEVVDGKQRLTSLIMWLNGDISAKLSDGTSIWADAVEGIRRVSVKIMKVELTKRECLEYYLKVNSGGTPHTEEDLDNVRHLLGDLNA